MEKKRMRYKKVLVLVLVMVVFVMPITIVRASEKPNAKNMFKVLQKGRFSKSKEM